MDLNFTPEQEAFRQEVRAFLKEKLTPELVHKSANRLDMSKEDIESWHATLDRRGWLVPSWPLEFGGTDWGPVEKFIFDDECAMANAPRIVPFGLGMLAPVLIKYGNEKQKNYWLPRIRTGEDWWCQGYSEPGAGSDLASLKTKAERVGDHYIVNGQKTWTTLGQYANMIFCLVRTSNEGKPQTGISFLLIDLDTPGIEMRPIRTIDGGYEVNEVFFTDVKVPVENLVGEENKGWTYAKYLLTHERTNLAGVGISAKMLERLKMVANDQQKNGAPLDQDPLFAARMAKVEITLRNMATTNLRVFTAVAGGGAPGAESSMLKIIGTEVRQEIESLTLRAVGRYARPQALETMEPGYNGDSIGPEYAGSIAPLYFNDRKISIFGGSNEIQKNIISKMIIGL